MPLSFAGIPLGFNTPTIDAWFQDYLELSDLRTVAAWPTAAWNNAGDIPQPNYSRPLDTKLNVWVHPTGAARWSYGFFLADGESLKKILAVVQTPNSTAQPLVMQCGKGTKRTFQAYLLPTRLISASANSGNPLWLLPLVDERYYWQHQVYQQQNSSAVLSQGQIGPSTTPHVGYSSTLSWSSLLGTLQTFMGTNGTPIVETDTANANYLNPDPIRFNKASYQNFALLIDVLAHSTGRRLVCDPYYQLVNFSTSTTQRIQNFAAQQTYDAGSLQTGSLTEDQLNMQATVPGSVNVAYRAYYCGVAVPDFDRVLPRYLISTTPTGLNLSPENTAVYTKTIRSTALADFTDWTTLYGSPTPVFAPLNTPNNSFNLTNLALQISADFYQSTNWLQDSNVIGMASWKQTGYDDYIEFSMRARPDGSLEGKTRIHTCPYNFAMEDMWHYESTAWEYGNVIVTSGGSTAVEAGQWGQVQGATASDAPVPVTFPNPLLGINITGQPIAANTMGITMLKVIDSATGPGFKVVGIGQMGPPGVSGTLGVASAASIVLSDTLGTFTTFIGGVNIQATVRRGLCFANELYLVGQNVVGTDGNGNPINAYEIVAPSTTCLVQNLTGATIPIGSSGTATILAGALGSETSTGITIPVLARFEPFRNNAIARAQLADSSTSDPPGWELQNTEDILEGRPTSLTIALNSATMNVYTGTAGSETSSGKTVSAFVREGLVLTTETYRIGATQGGYEVLNPRLAFRGKANADIATVAVGTVSIYSRTASTTYTDTTIDTGTNTVFNGLSGTVKSGANCEVIWDSYVSGGVTVEGWLIVQADC